MDHSKPIESFQFISDRSVADKYGIEVGIVRRWATTGLVPAVKLPASHRYLVSGPAVEALLLGSIVEAGEKRDAVAGFLESCTVADEGRAVSRELYEAYERWCHEAGHKPHTKHKFGRILNGMGYNTEKSSSVVFKRGLRLVVPGESSPVVSATG